MTAVRAFWIFALLCLSAPAFTATEGELAPPFEAKLLDGTTFSLSGASGDVVLIHFWATWCEPCRKEMPALESYYRKHRAEGLRIVAVSMDDSADDAKVRDVMAVYTYAAALNREASFKGYGRIWRIPLTFVIDRKGILRQDGGDGAEVNADSLERTLTPLLHAP